MLLCENSSSLGIQNKNAAHTVGDPNSRATKQRAEPFTGVVICSGQWKLEVGTQFKQKFFCFFNFFFFIKLDPDAF